MSASAALAPTTGSRMTPQEQVAHIGEVPLEIEVQLDQRWMKLREILELDEGSILEMRRSAGENIDIYAGSKHYGRSHYGLQSRLLTCHDRNTPTRTGNPPGAGPAGRRALAAAQKRRRHLVGGDAVVRQRCREPASIAGDRTGFAGAATRGTPDSSWREARPGRDLSRELPVSGCQRRRIKGVLCRARCPARSDGK